MDTSSTFIIAVLVIATALIYFIWSKFKEPKPEPTVYQKPKTTQLPPKKVVKVEEEDEATKDFIKAKIFFGSQTGTAEDFAHKLSKEAKNYKINAKVIDLEGYDTSLLAKEGFAIFLVATYGEGEPTDNAREFYSWITDESLSSDTLEGLKFTVFGLGNKTYEHYNAMGRIFDKRLEELGAQRIFNKGEGDDDASLEDDFAAWKKELFPGLVQHFGITGVKVETESAAQRRFKLVEFPDETPTAKQAKANFKKHLCKREGSSKEKEGYDQKNPCLANIVENRELHSPQSDRSCRHIEIAIPDFLTYEAGDHLGVYTENDNEVVERLAKRIGQDLDQVFALLPLDQKEDDNNLSKSFVGPCTYRQALMQWSDLLNPPRKSVLKVLAELASDPKEKKRLELLSDPEKNQPYQKWVKDDIRCILEILEEFPSVKITCDHLIEIMPRLAPRYYSISSSLKAHPNRVHITEVVVDFVTPANRTHLGVCSHWLAKQIPVNGHQPEVYVFLQEAKFRLPPKPTTPIVMVGPGTGLAPFRGFIQERAITEKQGHKSENLLFFGCRSSAIDFIYKDELLQYEKDGVITLSVAFSRDQAQKVYVQHKVLEKKEEVWRLINDLGGYFYVCGDARVMAKDVQQALKTIAMEVGKKNEDEANKYIEELKRVERYLTDVWF